MNSQWNKAWWLLAGFVLFVALYATHAKADEIYVGAWSHHFDDYDYNQEHRLVGVNYKSWVVGRFINSYSRETYFVGYDFRWSYKGLHAGVIASVSHGYRECFGDNGSHARYCAMPIPYFGFDAPIAPKFLFTHQMAAIAGTIQF